MIARACGKANVHDLDPEDLRALTLEAALITGHPARRARTGAPARARPARVASDAMSFLLACPLCGPRDVYEFRFGGEVQKRPAPGSSTGDLGAPTCYDADERRRASSARGGSIGRAAGAGSRPSATRATTA